MSDVRLLGGVLLLLGVMLVERGLHKPKPGLEACDWYALHPNGGGV